MNTNETHTDHQLFNRVADGEEAAFHILFERYKRKFYSAAYKLSGSHYLSEEVVQEVFIRIWKKRSLFKELESPEGYLHTLFYRELSQRYQKDATDRKRNGKAIEMPYQDDLTKEDVQLLEQQYKHLKQAVNELPPQQAQVFHLVKEKGLSREEVAHQLNLSPNTVRNHLTGAIKTLRKIVDTLRILVMFSAFFVR